MQNAKKNIQMRYKYAFSLSSIYDDNFKNKYKIYPDDNKFSLGIGLTSRCNFSCPICYYHTSKNNNPYTDIPLELLKKYLSLVQHLKLLILRLKENLFATHIFLMH